MIVSCIDSDIRNLCYLGYYVLKKDQYHRPIGLACIILAVALTIGMILFSAAWTFTHQPKSEVFPRSAWYEYSSPTEIVKIVVFYTIRTGMILPLITTTAAGTALILTENTVQEESAK